MVATTDVGAVPGRRLSETAYEILRDRIVSLELEPLTALSEKELSAELGIGLQPIREAIKRLEYEHLVSIFPRRGTFVAEVGIRDERRIAEIRVELEGLAARLAAEGGANAKIAELVELAETSRDFRGTRAIEAEQEFHRTLYALCNNSFLERSLNMFYNLSSRAWYYTTRELQLPQSEIRIDHTETAYAIRDRDPERAREAAARHVTQNSEELSRLLAGPRSRA
jgi:DNA-binding GntR family transcriptional regulator